MTGDAGEAGDIAPRLEEVRRRIAAAARRRGRDPAGVTLVAVPKGHPLDAARRALAAGATDLGENRVSELAARAAAVPGARWHLVGQLQTNKVRSLPGGLAAIHSVDRSSLVARLARRRVETGEDPDLFVEVNVSGERAKAGVDPADLGGLLGEMGEAGLRPVGLMTVAPLDPEPEAARPVFRALADLASQHGVPGLSMGMTNDFEMAVEEGATVVRVGRAIFGERPSPAGGQV